MIYEVTENSLSLNMNGYTLVDFYATWCGPCKALAKNIEQFSGLHPEINIKKVNVEENEELCEKYRVQNLPVIVCFKDGIESWRHVGLMTLKKLEEKFETC